MLTEEQKAIQNMALDFAMAEMAPHAMKWDEEKIFPTDVPQISVRRSTRELTRSTSSPALHLGSYDGCASNLRKTPRLALSSKDRHDDQSR